MYSTGAPKAAPPPVRPKPSAKLKQSAVNVDEVDSDTVQKKPTQDQKLVHRTLERPKRKGIRTPSKSSLSGTSLRTIALTSEPSQSLPPNAPADFDQPPPLPTSAPPPSTGDASEVSLPSDIQLSSTNDDNVFVPLSASPHLDEPPSDSELPPPLPMNDPPVATLNGLLSSHELLPLNKSLPSEAPPIDKPPPSNESPPISKHLSHTPTTHDEFNEPPVTLFNSLTSTSVPSPPNKTLPIFMDKKEASLLHDSPESPPYDAPPPLPSSYPPQQHDRLQLDNDKSILHEFHAPTKLSSHEVTLKDKEQVTLSDSIGSNSSPYVTSSSSGFSSIRQQEKPTSLMTSSRSVWSSSLHSNSLHSSLMDSHNQSFEDKSDNSLNSSNASLIKVPSTNTCTNNKPSSNVNKFRERIARLKQKREGLMPSPATSVQSEVVALNSRVTSPLQSSYSATLLDSSDNTFSKPHGDYTTSISPPLINSEELLTPSQSSPVSYPTTNFLHFASNPPTVSSDVKRVKPFTVKKISSSRISTTPTQLPPASNADISMGAKNTVDLHSESAFSKPSSPGITNDAVILSGLPLDIPVSGIDGNRSDDEDDGSVTPPPLPSSLPPDTFESDGFFAQMDVISDDTPPPDLPSIPPPDIPATTDVLEDEILDNGLPPLPTSPIPFEPSSTEQPFIEPLSIEPPKNFSQTPPEVNDSPILAPAEFTTAEALHDKVIPAPDHKTGLQPEVCKRSSPKIVRPVSHLNTRDVDSLSQTPTSTSSSRHSIHLQYDIEPDKNRSNNLPMFVCQQVVTQHQDNEPSDSKMQKSSKKSSKLKFPWQKRLTHDRSHSMSDERLKRKGKGSGLDLRHSFADIKQDVTDSSMMLRDRNVDRLKVTNEPVTSASVGDLRRPLAAKQNIDSFSVSHSELNKEILGPSLLMAPTASAGVRKPAKDEPDAHVSSNHHQQQLLKVDNILAESTVSLPHMTTPELYRKLSGSGDSSLLESVMKDIPLFNTNSTVAEEMIDQPPVEDQSKGKSSSLVDGPEELPTTPETFPDQREESFTENVETDRSPIVGSQECLNGSQSDSLHDATVDSFGSPPSPVASIRSDQGWSSSAANTPNLHDRRWREVALGSINTLTSNDSIRDLLKHRVTIGDWNVDHVVHWLESVGLSSVVPVFQHHSIDGAKLKTLNDAKLGEFNVTQCTVHM